MTRPCVYPTDVETMTGLVTADGRAFPLEDVRVEARASAGLARTTLRQRFGNPFREPLEVTYTLPLPADGAVTAYTMRIGEKTIQGEVQPREKAQQEYRKALEEGRTAGLLDQERADTFTQTLGNIPPGTPVEVAIDVLHPLFFHARVGQDPARWEYRFPTVVGVRYHGAPGRVNDREMLDVERVLGEGTPARLDLDLLLDDGVPAVLCPESASHGIAVDDASGAAGDDGGLAGTRTRVRLAESTRLDRDVTVRWTAPSAIDDSMEPSVHVTDGPGLPGDTGRYRLVTITPPHQAAERVLARDLTILIDASGSMGGAPLDLVKAFVQRILRSLRPEDMVHIVAFADSTRTLIGPASPATPACIEHALRKVQGLHASGGTEMASAIREALVPLRVEAQRQVLLLSDGYIGFESEVIAEVLANLPSGSRLHVVGVGSAPNRTLSRWASRAGRGIEQILGSGDDVNAAADRMLAGMVAPALVNVKVSGTAVLARVPERPADVFAGRPTILAVELRPEGGTLRVEGMRAGSVEPWSKEMVVDRDARVAGDAIPVGAYLGREAIEDQEMHLAALQDGEGTGILRRIEDLGMRHRIASRETSLVAIAEEPSVDPREPRVRMRLPVELPHGVSAEGVGLALGRGMLAGMVTHAAATIEVASIQTRALHAAEPLRPSRDELAPLRAARLIRTDGDLLVLEFESPDDGFHLPREGREIRVRFEDGEAIAATMDAQLSTARGPHRFGLTLRLALRRADGTAWPAASPVMVAWTQAKSPIAFRVERAQ